MKIRGREYSDYEEYLDEVQQYRLDALKEGRAEQENEKEEEDNGREKLTGNIHSR